MIVLSIQYFLFYRRYAIAVADIVTVIIAIIVTSIISVLIIIFIFIVNFINVIIFILITSFTIHDFFNQQ